MRTATALVQKFVEAGVSQEGSLDLHQTNKNQMSIILFKISLALDVAFSLKRFYTKGSVYV